MPSSKPEGLLQLAKDIMTRHTSPQGPSQVEPARASALQSTLAIADSNHSEGKSKDALAQSARQVRDVALGIAPGQTVNTKDTVLNLVTGIRDQLLLANEGSEEVLSQYGFNVVIGTAKSPVRRLKQAA
jgi:hypothetical protein